MPTLELIHVRKAFGARRVLDDISITVRSGESMVIMGPSGEGKSVLLKHFIGLLKPDSGEVRVDGVNIWKLTERERSLLRRHFGLAFQEGALFDSMNVFDNVAFPLRRQTSLQPEQIRARVDQCLELVRLPGAERRFPAELSTGMRRRVGFARAIALEPEILLFDEPTAALDPITVTVLIEVMIGLRRKLRATTVLVTHDLRTARLTGERIALLSRGRIVADEPTDEFLRSARAEVRQFIDGRPEGPLGEKAAPAAERGAPP